MNNLNEVRVPSKVEGFSDFQDIDRLRHYGQAYGNDALSDYGGYGARYDSVNPAAFFSDSVENNTKFLMDLYARERSYEEFRTTGVHRLRIDIPDKVKQLKLVAYYTNIDLGDQITQAETIAYSAFSPLDR